MKDLPRYYVVFARPVKVVEIENGGMTVLKLNWETGIFEYGMELLDEILIGRDEVEQVTEDEFIQHVEEIRGHRLREKGTVYALYDIINGLEEVAKEEGRELTLKERAMIAALRRETYTLFEETMQSSHNRMVEE